MSKAITPSSSPSHGNQDRPIHQLTQVARCYHHQPLYSCTLRWNHLGNLCILTIGPPPIKTLGSLTCLSFMSLLSHTTKGPVSTGRGARAAGTDRPAAAAPPPAAAAAAAAGRCCCCCCIGFSAELVRCAWQEGHLRGGGTGSMCITNRSWDLTSVCIQVCSIL